MTKTPDTAELRAGKHYCAEPECERFYVPDKWNKIRSSSEGWFHQRNGKSWCPDHLPEWVVGWREYKADLEAADGE